MRRLRGENIARDKLHTTLLIDADIVAFKYAAANQSSFDWGDGILSHAVNSVEDVKQQVDIALENWRKEAEADKVVLCFSCPSEDNFRLTILPTYKSNRKAVTKPVLLPELRTSLCESYTSYTKPCLEADDVLGILATHPKIIPGRKIVLSEDKDLKSIPGYLWNPRNGSAFKEISEEEANYWFLYQTLIGDSTDYYKGCPGIGPVKARQLLNSASWETVVSAFEATGLTEEDALVQARVARILRHTDYDFKQKKVIPWQPVKMH